MGGKPNTLRHRIEHNNVIRLELIPRKYADLILLPDNPLQVEPETIPQMAVWLTMVGGRVEFCAPDHEDLCP